MHSILRREVSKFIKTIKIVRGVRHRNDDAAASKIQKKRKEKKKKKKIVPMITSHHIISGSATNWVGV